MSTAPRAGVKRLSSSAPERGSGHSCCCSASSFALALARVGARQRLRPSHVYVSFHPIPPRPVPSHAGLTLPVMFPFVHIAGTGRLSRLLRESPARIQAQGPPSCFARGGMATAVDHPLQNSGVRPPSICSPSPASIPVPPSLKAGGAGRVPASHQDAGMEASVCSTSARPPASHQPGLACGSCRPGSGSCSTGTRTRTGPSCRIQRTRQASTVGFVSARNCSAGGCSMFTQSSLEVADRFPETRCTGRPEVVASDVPAPPGVAVRLELSSASRRPRYPE
jgi:hypothetical protein